VITERQREILRAARDRISDPERWTKRRLSDTLAQFHFSENTLDEIREGSCWCASGAIACESATGQEWTDTAKLFTTYFGEGISTYNDGHTHADVIQAFDELIGESE
jgi:hypothetical protein